MTREQYLEFKKSLKNIKCDFVEQPIEAMLEEAEEAKGKD